MNRFLAGSILAAVAAAAFVVLTPARLPPPRPSASSADGLYKRHAQRPIIVRTPLTASSFRKVLCQIAAVHRVALGIQLDGRALPQSISTPEASRQHDLTNLPPASALAQVVAMTNEYIAHAGTVVDIEPHAFVDNPDIPLNRVIPNFELDALDVQDALVSVMQQLHLVVKQPVRSLARPPRVAPFFERRLRFSMLSATVRDILNRLVSIHGGMSWIADYGSADGHGQITLSFVGFDNWATTVAAAQ